MGVSNGKDKVNVGIERGKILNRFVYISYKVTSLKIVHLFLQEIYNPTCCTPESYSFCHNLILIFVLNGISSHFFLARISIALQPYLYFTFSYFVTQ